MPLERQHGIIAHHAASIICDLDQLFSARLHADLDPRRARIQSVLEQLLHHGRRPLHHFAGGDLVGNLLGKYVNAAHEQFSS